MTQLAGREPPAMSEFAAILARLHAQDWSVAVHNDYKLHGENYHFWLMAHPSGFWAKGEGRSNLEALERLEEQATRRTAGHLVELFEALVKMQYAAEDRGPKIAVPRAVFDRLCGMRQTIQAMVGHQQIPGKAQPSTLTEWIAWGLAMQHYMATAAGAANSESWAAHHANRDWQNWLHSIRERLDAIGVAPYTLDTTEMSNGNPVVG